MKNNNVKKIAIISTALLVIDQLTKFLSYKFINTGNSFIQISTTKNEGLALGINSNNGVNIAIVLVVFALIFNFVYNQKDKLVGRTIWAVSLVISGGLGNFIDRIFKGGVVDFIKIGNFPIFNLADCFLVVGWLLLIFDLFVFNSLNDLNVKKILEAQDNELFGSEQEAKKVQQKLKNKQKSKTKKASN